MKSNYRYICFLLLLSLIACQEKFAERSDFRKVMEIHDEAMAEMGTMHHLEKRLKALKEERKDTTLSATIDTSIMLLHKADDGMMEWMRQFSKPEDKSTYASYLKMELEKVNIVNKDIFHAIEKAENIIEKHEND